MKTRKRKRPSGDVRPTIPSNAIVLNEEQRRVLSLATSRENIFFTGSAGSGKSFIIERLKATLGAAYGPERVHVTATTGIAAVRINGLTLHKWSGIGYARTLRDMIRRVKRNKKIAARWKSTAVLIIDEISMLGGALFSKLDLLGRAIRGRNTPFGGIQMIVTGDFFQLPPVRNADTGTVRFCFETSSWKQCHMKYVLLKRVYRQTDPVFVDILQRIRYGILTAEDASVLRKCRYVRENGIEATILHSTNKVVEKVNLRRLGALSGKLRVFRARDKIVKRGVKRTKDTALLALLNQTQALKKLYLKVGAQVLLTKNISDQLVNGSRGVVVGFGPSSVPIVKFANGHEGPICQEVFVVKNRLDGHVERLQIPLKCAWAITVHKSQGMGIDAVSISMRNMFCMGHFYVALSRVRTLSGLTITDFDASQVQANPKVLQFMCHKFPSLDVPREIADECLQPPKKRRKF